MNRNEIAREISATIELNSECISIVKQYANVIILRCSESGKQYRIEVRNNPT